MELYQELIQSVIDNNFVISMSSNNLNTDHEIKNLEKLSDYVKTKSNFDIIAKTDNKHTINALNSLQDYIRNGVNIVEINVSLSNAFQAAIISLNIIIQCKSLKKVQSERFLKDIFAFFKSHLNGIAKEAVEFMIEIGHLINTILTNDQFDVEIVQILSESFCELFFRNSSPYHNVSWKIFRTVLNKYESEREILMEDYITNMHLYNPNKSYYAKRIEPSTRVLFCLLQSLTKVTFTDKKVLLKISSEHCSNYNNLEEIIFNLLSTFFTTSADNANKRSNFTHFISELSLTCQNADWPASKLMITILRRTLFYFIQSEKSAINLRLFGLDCYMQLSLNFQDFEMKIQLNDIVDTVCQTYPEYAKQVPPPNSSNEQKQTLFLKKFLLDFNSIKSRHFTFSNDTFLCVWFAEYANTGKELPIELSQLLIENKFIDKNTLFEEEDSNDNSKYVRDLVYKRVYLVNKQADYDYFVKMITNLLETNISLRPKLTEFLKSIAHVNPDILTTQKIYAIIENLLGIATKDSHYIREILLEMFSNLINNTPIRRKYCVVLLDTIYDTSLTVTKKALQFFSEVFTLEKSAINAKIALFMLRRFEVLAEENNSIQVLLMEIFHEKYFLVVNYVTLVELGKLLVNCNELEIEKFEKLLTQIAYGNYKNKPSDVLDVLTLFVKKCVGFVMENFVELDQLYNEELEQFSSFLIVLKVFGNSAPRLLDSQLELLLPLLTGQKANVNTILAFVKFTKKVLITGVTPKEKFFEKLEAGLIKSASKFQEVTTSCIELLHFVVEKFTNNFAIVQDCFKSFYKVITTTSLKVVKKVLPISLVMIGSLMRFFNCETAEFTITNADCLEVIVGIFKKLMKSTFRDVQIGALLGFSQLSLRYTDLLLDSKVISYYKLVLSKRIDPAKMDIVLEHIYNVLLVEQNSRQNKVVEEIIKSDLKVMGDGNNESCNTVLKFVSHLKNDVINCCCTKELSNRKNVLRFFGMIVQLAVCDYMNILPSLIALTTDYDLHNSNIAEYNIERIVSRNLKSLSEKLLSGVLETYKLQRILQYGSSDEAFCYIKGFTIGVNNRKRKAHLQNVYQSLNKTCRLSFLEKLFNSIHDKHVRNTDYLQYILYLADNIVYFSYITMDEVLFVIEQINSLLIRKVYNLSTLQNLFKVKDSTELLAFDEYKNSASISEIPSENFTSFVAELDWIYASHLLNDIKLFLEKVYNINERQCKKVDLNKSMKVVVEEIQFTNLEVFDNTFIVNRLTNINSYNNLDGEMKEQIFSDLQKIRKLIDIDDVIVSINNLSLNKPKRRSSKIVKTPRKSTNKRKSVTPANCSAGRKRVKLD